MVVSEAAYPGSIPGGRTSDYGQSSANTNTAVQQCSSPCCMESMTRLCFSLMLLCQTTFAAEITSIGSRRELFVDKLLIDQMKGATLQLHHPEEAGIAVKFDQPWEGRFWVRRGLSHTFRCRHAFPLEPWRSGKHRVQD